MSTLTILLDTNEFIFGLTQPTESSAQLLEELPDFTVKLPRFILDELHNNLPNNILKALYSLLKETKTEIIEQQVPVSLVEKYQKQLPSEDAVIAAYCEFLKIKVLISENRHFLVDFHPKVFEVLSAQRFLERHSP